MTAAAVVVLAFIVLLVIYVALAIKIVQQYEQGLIERFGRYRKTVDPGFHMIVPFIERMVKVDMREQVVTFRRRRSSRGTTSSSPSTPSCTTRRRIQ